MPISKANDGFIRTNLSAVQYGFCADSSITTKQNGFELTDNVIEKTWIARDWFARFKVIAYLVFLFDTCRLLFEIAFQTETWFTCVFSYKTVAVRTLYSDDRRRLWFIGPRILVFSNVDNLMVIDI